MNRPNFVLITSDQQRADAIGAINPSVRTPHLDRLAAEGILFPRGYTVNPVCTPSRCSILTGQYPSRHGCFHVGTGLPTDYGPTVAHRLAEAGYFTGLLGKAHFQPCLDPKSFESAPNIHDLAFFRHWTGPYYGFERAKLVIGHTSEPHGAGMHYGAWLEDQGVDLDTYFGIHEYSRFGGWELPEEYHGSKWVADETIDAIDHAVEEEKPFFLWSSFQDPHNPYVTPEPWASMYRPEEIADPIPEEGSADGKPPFYQSLLSGEFYGDDPDLANNGDGDVRRETHLTPEAVRETRAAYYGMVSLMDHHIGRIVAHLETRGLLDSTIIVFTSDHGDYLGDYGIWGKGLPAYEAMQRVPFIVRHPECRTPGATSTALQSVVDIEATFCRAADLDQAVGSQGVDQNPSWIDAGQRSREWALLEFKPSEGPFEQRTLVTDQYKLVHYNKRDPEYGELYDLTDDPDQLRNLYNDSEYATVREALERQLIDAEIANAGPMRPRTAFA